MRRRARASLGGWMQATRRHSSQLPGRPEKAPPCTNAALGRRGQKASRQHLSQGSVPGVLAKRRASWPSPCSLSPTSGVFSPHPSTGLWHTAVSLQVRRGCRGKVAPNLCSARPGSLFLSFTRPSQNSSNVRGFQKPLPTLPLNRICPLLSQLWDICHFCRVLP